MVKTGFLSLTGLLLLMMVTGCMPPVRSLIFDVDSKPEPYSFQWSTPEDEYLVRFRKEYQLDTLIAGKQTDLERVQAVAHWVHGLWQHDRDYPANYDAISIIKEAKNGKKFSCLEYSYVNAQILSALGFKARITGLMTEDCETRSFGAVHVVTEVWLPDLNRWIMVDPQWDVIITLDGMPLNCLQLQFAIAQKLSGVDALSLSDTKAKKYLTWIGPYLYYFQIFVDNRYSDKQRSKEQILLYPIGAPAPQVFQKTTPIVNTKYTHIVQTFYRKPE